MVAPIRETETEVALRRALWHLTQDRKSKRAALWLRDVLNAVLDNKKTPEIPKCDQPLPPHPLECCCSVHHIKMSCPVHYVPNPPKWSRSEKLDECVWCEGMGFVTVGHGPGILCRTCGGTGRNSGTK